MSIRDCIKKHKLEQHEAAILNSYLNEANTYKVADFKDTNDAREAALEAINSMIALESEKYNSIINAIGNDLQIPKHLKLDYLDINKENTLKKESIINKVKDKFKNALEKEFKSSKVLEQNFINFINKEDIPKNISQDNNVNDINAYVINGNVYFVADNLNSLSNKEIIGLIKHEVAEHILKLGVNDSTYKNIISQIRNLKGNNTDIDNAYNSVPKNTSKENIDKEALAYLLQNNKELNVVNKFVSWFKNKLRSIFGDNIFKNFTVNDINFLANNSLKSLSFKEIKNINKEDNTLYSLNSITRDIIDNGTERFNDAFIEVKQKNISKAVRILFNSSTNPTMNFYDRIFSQVNRLAEKYDAIKKYYAPLKSKFEFNNFMLNAMFKQGKNLFLNGDTSWVGFVNSINPVNILKFKEDTKKVWDVISERMNEEGVQGKRYTNQELSSKGLNTKQISMYNEALDLVNNGLDMNFKEFLINKVKYIKEINLKIEDIVYKKGTNNTELNSIQGSKNDFIRELSRIKNEKLNGDIFNNLSDKDKSFVSKINSTIDEVNNQYNRVLELKDKGYMPAKRFGPYIVNIYKTDASGNKELEYSTAYENADDRRVAIKELKNNFGSNYTIETKDVSRNLIQLMTTSGIANIDAFIKHINSNVNGKIIDDNGNEVNANDLIDELTATYKALKVNPNSPINNLLKRKGIAGYSDDLQRVVSTYVSGSARRLSNSIYNSEITNSIAEINNDNSISLDIKDYIAQHNKDMSKNIDNKVVKAIKNFTFFTFLGGNVSSAVLQLFNIPLMQVPYATQVGGKNGVKHLGSSITDVLMNNYGQFYNLISIAEKKGILGNLNSFDFANNTENSGGASSKVISNLFSGTKRGLIYMFATAELTSKKISFLTGLKIAKDKNLGVDESIEFAKNFMETTNGLQASINKSSLSRTAIGSIATQFKDYITTWIEMFSKIDNKSKLIALAMIVPMAGLSGMPGADDIENLIDIIGQQMGYNTNSKKAFKKFLRENLGDTVGEFADTGLSSLLPTDFSTRVGMNNILPGEQLFKRSEKDKLKAALEIAGPTGGFIKSKLIDSIDMLESGDLGRAATNVLPSFLSNFAKGINMLNTGIYDDYLGKSVAKVDTTDAVLKMFGFQPSVVSDVKSKSFLQKQNESYHDLTKQEISRKIAISRFKNDPELNTEALDQLREYNSKNVDKIKLNYSTISKLVKDYKSDQLERDLRHTSKEMRILRKQETNY